MILLAALDKINSSSTKDFCKLILNIPQSIIVNLENCSMIL